MPSVTEDNSQRKLHNQVVKQFHFLKWHLRWKWCPCLYHGHTNLPELTICFEIFPLQRILKKSNCSSFGTTENILDRFLVRNILQYIFQFFVFADILRITSSDHIFMLSWIILVLRMVLTYDLLEDGPTDDITINNISLFLPYKKVDSMWRWVYTINYDRWSEIVIGRSVTHSAALRVPLFCPYHILTSTVLRKKRKKILQNRNCYLGIAQVG